MIKNSSPDKSGNPESLNKLLQQFERFSNNVPIVGKNLLRVLYRLFYLQFCDSSDPRKKICSKGTEKYFCFFL